MIRNRLLLKLAQLKRMDRLCLQCNRWAAARDGLCLLCRAGLGIVQISKQENFTEEDFDFAVDSLNQLLGNLTSRAVSAPSFKSGRDRPEDSTRGSGRDRPSGGTSSHRGERSPFPETPKSERSHTGKSPETNIKSLPLHPQEERESRTDRSRGRRRRHRAEERAPSREPSLSRERSRRRRSKSPEVSESRATKKEPAKAWKPSLRPSEDLPRLTPPRAPPRVDLQERSDRRARTSRSPSLSPSHKKERGENNPPRKIARAKEEPASSGNSPGSAPPSGDRGSEAASFQGKAGKGKKGKGKPFKGKGKGKPPIPIWWDPYSSWWSPPPPKKKNRGLKRPEWWAKHKGKGKGEERETPDSAVPPAPLEEGSPSTTGTSVPEGGAPTASPPIPPEDTPGSGEAARRDRERAWADATP